MQIVVGLGLLLTLLLGMMAIPEISALQDQGEALSGDISIFFSRVTGVFLIVTVVIGAGTLVALFAMLFNRR